MGSCEQFLDATVRKGAFTRSTTIMFFAELGDKTMLMGLGLATQFDPLGVFTGAILALAFVNGIGVFAGEKIARKIPRRIIGLFSGLLFLITGLLILIFWLHGENKNMNRKLTRTILLTATIAIMAFLGVFFTRKIISPSFQITNAINSNLVDIWKGIEIERILFLLF